MLGEAARLQGDHWLATARFEESIIVARGVEDKVGVAGSLVSLGAIAHAEGDNARAALGTIVGAYKAAVTRQIRRDWSMPPDTVWHTRYHDHILDELELD